MMIFVGYFACSISLSQCHFFANLALHHHDLFKRNRDDKRFHIQRLRNVCYRVHKRNAVRHIAMNSFPMGLVNHCDLCAVDIEHFDGLLTHFCSALHTEKLQENSRISFSDIACWNKIFSVQNNMTQMHK